MIRMINNELAAEMLTVVHAEEREKVHNVFQGFNRLLSKINAYVGELAFVDEQEKKDDG